MGRSRKCEPIRAKRSTESVERKRIALGTGGARRVSDSRSNVSRTAFAVVAAESTILMSGPMAARMAPASMGKWVHPNTRVSGGDAVSWDAAPWDAAPWDAAPWDAAPWDVVPPRDGVSWTVASRDLWNNGSR